MTATPETASSSAGPQGRLELVVPTTRLHGSWLESRTEWGVGVHQAGAGLWVAEDLDVETAEGFAAWLDRLRAESDATTPLGHGKVPATYWWVTQRETYLGAITLRHSLNDFLLQEGGHIGYGIRPSARGRGVATWALGQVLPVARAMGLTRVLLTCDDDNTASARTIERHGGILEDVRLIAGGRKRRYWIEL